LAKGCLGHGAEAIGPKHHKSDAKEKMLRKNAMHTDTQNSKWRCETESTPKERKHRQLHKN
jgi:hypothetical protein